MLWSPWSDITNTGVLGLVDPVSLNRSRHDRDDKRAVTNRDRLVVHCIVNSTACWPWQMVDNCESAVPAEFAIM